MGKYKFYQDRKVTSWERDYFSVEADSYEEAVSIIRSWGCEDVSNIATNVCFMTNGLHCPKLRNACYPKKTAGVRLWRFSINPACL